MRHGRKSKHQRFDGYKVHLTEEPGSELVTAVAVTPANTPDGQVAAALVRQARAVGAAPRELVGDLAYGTGDVRAEVAAAGATVVAKVPPHANADGSARMTSPSTCPTLPGPRRPAQPEWSPPRCAATAATTAVVPGPRCSLRPARAVPARCGPAALAAPVLGA
jgi:hypothetical protein